MQDFGKGFKHQALLYFRLLPVEGSRVWWNLPIVSGFVIPCHPGVRKEDLLPFMVDIGLAPSNTEEPQHLGDQ